MAISRLRFLSRLLYRLTHLQFSVTTVTLRCGTSCVGNEPGFRKSHLDSVVSPGLTESRRRGASNRRPQWCSPSQTVSNRFCHVATMVVVNHCRAALRKQWESSMIGFLASELEMAKTFIKLARDSRDPHRQAMHIENAQKACDAVKHFLERAPLPAIETFWIRGELDSIEPTLRSLRSLASQTPRG